MRGSRRISRGQASAIAEAEARRRGFAWTPPVKVQRKLRGYQVWTKADSVGGNVITDVTRDGRVTYCGVVPK